MIDENTYHFLELCELNSLPDKELNKKGLKREEIVEELYLYGDYAFDGSLKPVANVGFKKALQKNIYTTNTDKAVEIYNLIEKMEGAEAYINSLKAVNKLFLLAQKKRSYISPTELDKAIIKELRNRITDLCCQSDSYFHRFKTKKIKPKIKSKPVYETLNFIENNTSGNPLASFSFADIARSFSTTSERRSPYSSYSLGGRLMIDETGRR